MTKTGMLKQKAELATENKNVRQALVGYFLHLSHNVGDYAGATKEAAYDLELTDEKEFKNAIVRMAA